MPVCNLVYSGKLCFSSIMACYSQNVHVFHLILCFQMFYKGKSWINTIFSSDGKCRKLSENVGRRSGNVGKCREVVGECREMSAAPVGGDLTL